MQSMKNATQLLNKPEWPQRRADKLSAAAALRQSKIGGSAHEFSAARRGPVSALGLYIHRWSHSHNHVGLLSIYLTRSFHKYYLCNFL